MRFLLDTNILVRLLNGTEPAVERKIRQTQPPDIGLSVIVMHELYFGAYKSMHREQNLARLAALRFEVLPFDKEDADAAAEIRAILKLSGTPIGPYDVLIAGQARSRGLVLVTNNIREFERVPDLAMEDWTGPAPEGKHP